MGSNNKEIEESVRNKFVGKTEDVFLTQYAFDLKVEDLKTATNPNISEKKITVHVYGNDKAQLSKDAKLIYDEARKLIK